MSTAVVLALVAALSGVPAAAVMCDLVLCVTPPSEAAGCHEHGEAQPGAAIAAAADACTHLAATTPFLGPAARQVIDGGIVAMPAAPIQRFIDAGSAARTTAGGAPPPVPARTPTVLRI